MTPPFNAKAKFSNFSGGNSAYSHINYPPSGGKNQPPFDEPPKPPRRKKWYKKWFSILKSYLESQ